MLICKKVPCLMYVDIQRPDEGVIEPDYVVWINKVRKVACSVAEFTTYYSFAGNPRSEALWSPR